MSDISVSLHSQPTKDPLVSLAGAVGFEHSRILRMAYGEKYAAVMVEDGGIGVCATLGTPFRGEPKTLRDPDYARHDHRIVVNAYINACINGNESFNGEGDLFDSHPFSIHSTIVMIGYFIPLVEKFRQKKIPLKVFDRHHHHPELTAPSELDAPLREAEVVILTSTTLANGTFGEMIERIPPEAAVFMLGPSTPLHSGLFEYSVIKGLYGMLFNKYDEEVLSIIDGGGGTQSFGRRGKKVSLS